MAKSRLWLSGLGFGPTVGGGVLAAVLCLVASTKAWLGVSDSGAVTSVVVLKGLTEAPPLASSLSLVLLAGWGALLVTRGRIRRLVAALAALAALTLVGIGVSFATTAAADARTTLKELGATGVETTLGVWFWVALIAALASVALAAVAVRSAPNWPEMSRRYDAPSAQSSDPSQPDLTSTIDVWKAMDQGKDPTA